MKIKAMLAVQGPKCPQHRLWLPAHARALWNLALPAAVELLLLLLFRLQQVQAAPAGGEGGRVLTCLFNSNHKTGTSSQQNMIGIRRDVLFCGSKLYKKIKMRG